MVRTVTYVIDHTQLVMRTEVLCLLHADKQHKKLFKIYLIYI